VLLCQRSVRRHGHAGMRMPHLASRIAHYALSLECTLEKCDCAKRSNSRHVMNLTRSCAPFAGARARLLPRAQGEDHVHGDRPERRVCCECSGSIARQHTAYHPHMVARRGDEKKARSRRKPGDVEWDAAGDHHGYKLRFDRLCLDTLMFPPPCTVFNIY
jgi:hypothetical protein